jgi:2-dehydropantoate 2-reductase
MAAPRRYLVLGAGAVGAAIGGRLARAGREVVLVARGAHLEALRRDGLRLRTPDADDVIAVPAVATPAEADVGPGDLVVLATKTQDSTAALEALAAVAGPETPIACAQNGVANERLALRRFERVYGVNVWLPAELLTPGLVHAFFTPQLGALYVGRYPAGSDETAAALAADFEAAGFRGRAVEDVMRWKHNKLLSNLGNALEAACGPAARQSELLIRAGEEAQACYLAAGIHWVSDAEEEEHRRGLEFAPVAGRAHQGGSSWQSLARGAGSIEADYLNGEIALLGRLHGVPTPVNVALQRVAARMVAERRPAGSMRLADVERQVG